MDPNEIKLNSVHKSFEYEKISRLIDGLSLDETKLAAKFFCKLYLAQQETITAIHTNL